MQCPRCHAENRAGRRFCGECGLSLATCQSCGFQNDGTEKFCGGCGRSLTPSPTLTGPQFGSPQSYTPKHLAEKILTSKAALEGERKQVTVLFADLKGSMRRSRSVMRRARGATAASGMRSLPASTEAHEKELGAQRPRPRDGFPSLPSPTPLVRAAHLPPHHSWRARVGF